MRPRRPPLCLVVVPLTIIAAAACSTYEGASRAIGRDASGDYVAMCQTSQRAQGPSRGGDLRPAMFGECEQSVWVTGPAVKTLLEVATKRAPCTDRAVDCSRVEATLVVRRDPAGDVVAMSLEGTTKVLVRGADGVLLDDRCSPSPSKDAKAALAAAPLFMTAARCP